MRIRVIAVGDIKQNYFRAAIAEYHKRLGRYAKVEILEIKERPISEAPSKTEIEKALEREGEEILARLEAKEQVWILAIEGKQYESEKLAQTFAQEAVEGVSQIAFVIGSSYGLSPEVKKRGRLFSFSKMTFPHQLIRVMLMEQIYRAMSIIHHEKYHK